MLPQLQVIGAKEKVILILVKTVRKTLFKELTLSQQSLQWESTLLQLSSEHSREIWGFTANKQGKGVSGQKITKRRHQGQGDFAKLVAPSSSTCLSQRLNYACLSAQAGTVKLWIAH